MGVYIPSFQHAFPAPGLNAPPASAIAGITAGAGLINISAGLTESAMAKKQFNTFADAIEIEDPQTAALLRAQAQSVPLISGFGGSGTLAGGGGRSGGQSNVGNALLESSLTRLRDERLQRQRLEAENVQHINTLDRMGQSFSNALQLQAVNAGNDQALARLRDQLDEEISPERKALLDQQYQLKVRELDQERLRIDNAINYEKSKLTREQEDAAILSSGGAIVPGLNSGRPTDPTRIKHEYLSAPEPEKERIIQAATIFALDNGISLPPAGELITEGPNKGKTKRQALMEQRILEQNIPGFKGSSGVSAPGLLGEFYSIPTPE